MATAVAVHACGGDHQGRLTSSAQSGSGSGGFSSGTCDPPCSDTEVCSVTGQCLEQGLCGADEDCPEDQTCVAGECSGCTPPNLLLAIDRSCSMTGTVGGISKWSHAVDAMKQLLADHEGELNFGLLLFPDTVAPECEQSSIAVPVGPAREAAIEELLSDSLSPANVYYPDDQPCVTNIDAAMQQAAAEPAFRDTTRASFVLLMTDGKQTGCSSAGGDAGTLQTITDLWQERGIGTFVVGFGSGVDPAQLNSFANAGGMATDDPTCMPQACHYYRAENGATLTAALDVIADEVGCKPIVR
jgi:hypothetical protein